MKWRWVGVVGVENENGYGAGGGQGGGQRGVLRPMVGSGQSRIVTALITMLMFPMPWKGWMRLKWYRCSMIGVGYGQRTLVGHNYESPWWLILHEEFFWIGV